jgi:hypothetical protein
MLLSNERRCMRIAIGDCRFSAFFGLAKRLHGGWRRAA